MQPPDSTVALVVCLLASLVHGEFVDMTHDFDTETIYWPTNEAFNLTMESRGPSGAGFWYETEDIAGSTHGGTHLDAPAHFAQGKWHVQDIPIGNLVGPAVIIDIREKAKNNPIAQVTVSDIAAWERQHGQIPPRSIIVMQSGWTAKWPDKLSYLGTISKDTSLLRFPGWDPSAAEWLTQNRDFNGIGVDTPSADYGPSTDFRTHVIMAKQNKFNLENVKIPDNMPLSGARILAMPMKIKTGSGAPCRIVGFWGEDNPLVSDATTAMLSSTITTVWMVFFVVGLSFLL